MVAEGTYELLTSGLRAGRDPQTLSDKEPAAAALNCRKLPPVLCYDAWTKVMPTSRLRLDDLPDLVVFMSAFLTRERPRFDKFIIGDNSSARAET